MQSYTLPPMCIGSLRARRTSLNAMDNVCGCGERRREEVVVKDSDRCGPCARIASASGINTVDWLLRKVAAFYPVPSTFTRIITTITTTTVAIATTQQIAKQESKEWWCAEP